MSRSGQRLKRATAVVIAAATYAPAPAAMPIAAVSQSVAAVVSPRTEKPWRMIAPAPRKPIPVTICAATRVGSTFAESNPYAPAIVNSAAPTATRRCVRSPASRSRNSRSSPTEPPRTPASAIRSRASSQLRLSELDASCCNGFVLCGDELFDAAGRELEQLVEARARERRPLRGRLHLDERGVAGHDDVHVDLGRRVLGIVEVEQRGAVDDADRDRGDRTGQCLREPETV